MLLKLLCLLLLCSNASCSRREKEHQYCGEDRFYCPSNTKCFDRNQRCTRSNVCVDSGGKEAECSEESPGRYNYYKKESSISSSSSSKRKRSVSNFRHWFVEYRGFAYEFGSYGAQELDVNDPNYKYGPGREKVESVELVGTSSCTRDDVLRFRDQFIKANPKYRLFANNCQDFVKHLIKRLKKDCRINSRSLDDEAESLKANCSTTKSSSSMLSLDWKLFASFAALFLFTKCSFCM